MLRSILTSDSSSGLAIGVAGFAFQFYVAAKAGYDIITAAKATSEAASRLQTLMGFEHIRYGLALFPFFRACVLC
jgi:hypothetical protein